MPRTSPHSPRRRARALLIATIAVAGGVCGCASDHPEDAVREIVAAVRSRDAVALSERVVAESAHLVISMASLAPKHGPLDWPETVGEVELVRTEVRGPLTVAIVREGERTHRLPLRYEDGRYKVDLAALGRELEPSFLDELVPR